MQKGLLCTLTEEYADFDETCSDFEADETAIVTEFAQQKELEYLEKSDSLQGANWFLWIGILSCVNIILIFVIELQFVFGLGVTQVIQAVANEFDANILGIVIAVLISGFYVWTYYLTARKGQLWSYIIGWTIYLIDALLYLFSMIIKFDVSVLWSFLLHIILLIVLYAQNPLFSKSAWLSIKNFEWAHDRIAYIISSGMLIFMQIACLSLMYLIMSQN